MRIAVFADVHGRILLAFKLVARYQRETGKSVDLILQCGDMGIFPNIAKLDKATRRHAKTKNTELGFSDYFASPNPEAEAILAQTDCKLLCVRGNHEDHAYLDRLESASAAAAFPVDCYQRIYVLKGGVRYDVVVGDRRLRMLGIGRVGAPVGETDPMQPKYIQKYERERLLEFGEAGFNLMLTHDTRPELAKPGCGMIEIELMLRRYRPLYHFFGHTGRPFSQHHDPNGLTVSVKFSDLEWENDRGQRLKSDCFGVLRWENRDDHELEVVSAPWLREYTAHTWQYVV